MSGLKERLECGCPGGEFRKEGDCAHGLSHALFRVRTDMQRARRISALVLGDERMEKLLTTAIDSWRGVERAVRLAGAETWTDHDGRAHLVPKGRKINFSSQSGRAIRAHVLKEHDFSCVVCGAQFEVPHGEPGILAPYRLLTEGSNGERPLALHIDHIVPVDSGGTHHPANLQTLCSVCNSRKGARTTLTSEEY